METDQGGHTLHLVSAASSLSTFPHHKAVNEQVSYTNTVTEKSENVKSNLSQQLFCYRVDLISL